LQSLDDEMLASIPTTDAAPAVVEILVWRSKSRQVLDRLAAVTEAADKGAPLLLAGEARGALDELDALAVHPAHLQRLALELNRYDQPGFKRLLNAMRDQVVESPVLSAALLEMRKREIRVVAGNIRKSVIYPSLHLLWQTRANTELLLRADQMLLQATQAREVNQALDEIISGYRSRNKLPGLFWRPRTVELAKAWRVKA
jgi:exoenzyme U